MIKTYKITKEKQWQLAKAGVIWNLIFISFFVTLSIYHKSPIFLIPLLLIGLLFFSPQAFLHFTYYKENKNTTLKINEIKQDITIETLTTTYKYSFSDIKYIVKYFHASHIPNPTLFYNPRPTDYDKYGYVLIVFNDEKGFCFTSLMIDIFAFNLNIYTSNRYYHIPYLKHSESKLKNKSQLTRFDPTFNIQDVTNFKTHFENLSTENLKDKIANQSKYEWEAIAAAKEILKERGVY